MKPKKELNLSALEDIKPIPSKKTCGYYIEAASVCLSKFHNNQSINLKIEGDWQNEIQIQWEEVDELILDNWSDLSEATEAAATCIAILMVNELTDYKVVKRSPKKTGFDYWLSDKKVKYPLEFKARLEISGILKGSLGQINWRVKEKKEQTKQSDRTKLPAIIAVTEFSRPLLKIQKR